LDDLDKNRITFWFDAKTKEMENLINAFEIMDLDLPIPCGFTKAPLQMIFDLKSDFTRKAR